MRESRYQAQLINTLEAMFPGIFIVKNDSGYRQGIPDLLLLYGNCWAMLEVKASYDAPTRPNQDYYIGLFDELSFATFVYPENEEEVLLDLQRAFTSRRKTRFS